MLGLYLHIPFCSSICPYCNFNRGLYDAALKTRYVDAIETEIRRIGGRPAADTMFFGGGTPSLLEPADVRRLIEACRQQFAMSGCVEITLETNPETVDRARLDGFRAVGVNRLSFGVQSFADAELARLGRMHSAERARRVVREARAAGFDDISLDLMMWLPEQTIAAWLDTVEALIDAGPDHASLYLLELYPNAPLREEMARARWSVAPDDDAAEMYLRAFERLDAAGYEQYEISNVARPGRQSRHNLKYWSDGEWLGFGCGAHSTRHGARWKNIASTEEYVARLAAGGDPEGERRILTPDERVEEALFTGLRLSAGVDIEAVGARYGCDVWGRFGDALQPFIEQGLLERQGSRLRLPRPGMLLANEIMSVFV
ncbi:MAG TPA: radical SAM family heme chaperone HemW [Vicinamibacterales bacterium]|nr:radical SAM family heme chaperone HemW [Vicinamibacterales bacterium]